MFSLLYGSLWLLRVAWCVVAFGFALLLNYPLGIIALRLGRSVPAPFG